MVFYERDEELAKLTQQDILCDNLRSWRGVEAHISWSRFLVEHYAFINAKGVEIPQDKIVD